MIEVAERPVTARKPWGASEPEHALIPKLTEAQGRALVRRWGVDEGARRIDQFWDQRRLLIRKAAVDPINWAPRPKLWRIANRILRREGMKVLVLLGGNRSSKSFFCAYLLVETALGISRDEVQSNEGVTFLVVSETEESSIDTAQRIVWTLLPPQVKALNGRRDKTTFIHRSEKQGFTDKVLVLPTGVKIQFQSYLQDPGAWEGRELGLKHRRGLGWWADENMTLPWFQMFQRRGRYRPGFGVWSFTPVRGITGTIKEAVGTGRIFRTRPGRLIPQNQVVVPGCRPGRVPFVQEGRDSSTMVAYFHSDLTPFGSGGRRYSELVEEEVKGRPTSYVLAVYYGWTRDEMGRAWPKFTRGSHMIQPEELPWRGTNYQFIDPAGSRAWFMIWVRVAPGNPRRLFVYRDWPDVRRYGEWAVPTSRALSAEARRGRDGDTGPAQRNPGWGIERYKEEILAAETVAMTLGEDGAWLERDPQRRHLLNQRMLGAGEKPIELTKKLSGMEECRWTAEAVKGVRERVRGAVMEPVFGRLIDPRAAGSPQAAEKGGTTILSLFEEEQRARDGQIIGPSMPLAPAYSGREIEEGIRAVNDLLDYDERRPVLPLVNEPALMVAAVAQQVIGVLEAYTGEGSEVDGWKDAADTLRYLGLSEHVSFVEAGSMRVRKGWSY